MLDPGWIAAYAPAFDLMHVHFGLEAVAPARLRAIVAALRAAGRPLVLTVHDLAHPQLADPEAYAAQLGVVVPAADALVTLTPGAAAEIARRWDREAVVVPHPAIVVAGAGVPVGTRRQGGVVGLQLRDLRPNVDGPGATATLLAAVARLRAGGADVHARVTLHDRVRDPAARDAVRALCAAAGPAAELREGPRPGDAALQAALADLDAVVLPYRHGTHSGWLELCWDLGVPVAAPPVGHLADQHPVATFAAGDPASLAAALRGLLGASPPGSAARRARVIEHARARAAVAPGIAAAHDAVYRAVLGR
jgi:hypothetical protein